MTMKREDDVARGVILGVLLGGCMWLALGMVVWGLM